MQKTTHEVVVRKDIKLGQGESLRQFTAALSDSGRTFMKQKLNLDPKKSDVFTVEVFKGSVVFEVYRFGPDVEPKKRMTFFAMTHKRNDQGGFTFDNMIEVERITAFQAKPQGGIPVTTAKASRDVGCDGWQRTTKSLWSGVV